MSDIKQQIKNILIKLHLYPIHRYLKLKYHNYLGELGYFRQKFYQFFAQFDQELQCQQRSQIAAKIKLKANPILKDAAIHLKQHGFLQTTFSALGIQHEEMTHFLKEKIDRFQPHANDLRFYQSLDSGKYANKALSYHLHKITKDNTDDPLLQFAINTNLIQLASMYLDYLPLLDLICLTVTPSHTGSSQFGAQLWHRDLNHKHCLKLFYTPVNLTMEHGPFQFFAPHLSTYRYYQHAPQSMTDIDLLKAGLDPQTCHSFLGGENNLLLIDTARCLHRGGKTLHPRFLTTMGYFSPLHSFSERYYKTTNHYKIAFDDLKIPNQVLLENFK